MLTGKIWGSTECLLDTPLLSMHRLKILPNMACSMHCHQFKANGFFVTRGRLIIEVRKKAYNLVDRTVLESGDLTSVQPGEFHRFVTESEGCEGIEFYYLGTLSEDIIRESCGGPCDIPVIVAASV